MCIVGGLNTCWRLAALGVHLKSRFVSLLGRRLAHDQKQESLASFAARLRERLLSLSGASSGVDWPTLVGRNIHPWVLWSFAMNIKY